MKKNFLTLLNRSPDELILLIKEAIAFKKNKIAGKTLDDVLQGKSVGLLFEKPSTRSRVSFEVAVDELGGNPVFLSSHDTHLDRGESIKDTSRVLSKYFSMVIYRAQTHTRLEEFAKYSSIPVINALSDLYHPCQLLADAMTIYEEFGRFQGVKVAYVGDGNYICQSWVNAAARFGFNLSIGCPAGYEPDDKIVKKALDESKKTGTTIEIYNDALQAVKDADVVATDIWRSRGGSKDQKSKSTLLRGFQINRALMANTNHAIVLHCLPAHIGEEITEDIFEGASSRIFDEAANRLHVQKALIKSIMG